MLTATAIAAPQNMDTLYNEFQKSREQFLATPVSKKDFATRFQELDSTLNQKYNSFKVLQKDNLDPKGNQMAFDLELMEPLRNLASSKMTKQDCLEAKHINDLNATEDEKSETDSIFNVLKNVCY